MKTAIILLTCATLSLAAPPNPTNEIGFFEVPWGASPDEVKQQMSTKAGVTFNRSEPNRLIFHGGTFAGSPANAFCLRFITERFYQGDAFFPESLHANLKKEFTAKYGNPASTGKDGLARWEFPPSVARKQHYVIELAPWKDRQVRIAYTNQTLRGARVTAKDDL